MPGEGGRILDMVNPGETDLGSVPGGGAQHMYDPMLFRDRERPAQIVLAGVVPAIAGAIAGVLIGASSGAYWAYSAAIALATIVGGFEHGDGWDAADRGLIAGADLWGRAAARARARRHPREGLARQLPAVSDRDHGDRRDAVERDRRQDGAGDAERRAAPAAEESAADPE